MSTDHNRAAVQELLEQCTEEDVLALSKKAADTLYQLINHHPDAWVRLDACKALLLITIGPPDEAEEE
jgi:hypothetical protein